jgi:hypothetical protein
MARRAKVTAIDALQAMSVALERFRGDAVAALDELDMEIRRALEWIHHDRKDFWTEEVRRGWERTAEARLQLQQAQTFKSVGDHRDSCVDEKKALERAKRRLDVAQEKVVAVRHWRNVIDRAVNEYRAARAQLGNWLDADEPKAVAELRRMSQALSAYVATEMPDDGPLPAFAGPAVEQLGESPAYAGGQTGEEQTKPCEPGI